MRRKSKLSSRKTQTQLFQYLFVGGLAAIVDVGMFALFLHIFSIDYRIAIVLGFSCGVLTNFSLCNWIVFSGKRRPLWLVFARHYLASISILLCNEILMITLVEVFDFKNLVLAKLISSGVAFIFNFFIKKIYVYNDSYYIKADTIATSSLIERRSQR